MGKYNQFLLMFICANMIIAYAVGTWGGTSRKRPLGGGHCWDSESWRGEWDRSRHNRASFTSHWPLSNSPYKMIYWSESYKCINSTITNHDKYR